MQANFNRYRKDLKKAITNAKRSHYKTLFERFKFDMKKTWSIISENLNKNVQNPIPDKITIYGVDCCDKQVIADNFNSFFASIGEQNARNITEEPGNSSYRDYLTDRIDSQFIFPIIDNNYTIQIIKNIKTSRSIGHGGISSELLKLINNDISACITLIINQSIKSGIFSDRLKIAKVTPIYKKKDDKRLIKNYRPISVLPVISKVFETVICDQLCEYFSSKNQLCSQQYGFRKNSSTELAALKVIDRLLTQLDGQLIPINFFLDLSKAFDSLNHNILIIKLSYYGVTHMANTLLRSYLSNRKQYVMVGDVSSSTQPITSGVPQGYVIGPFLFNILINDIIKSSEKFNFILYTDDTTLNSTLDVFGDTVNEIQLAIMMDLQKKSKWLDLN